MDFNDCQHCALSGRATGLGASLALLCDVVAAFRERRPPVFTGR